MTATQRSIDEQFAALHFGKASPGTFRSLLGKVELSGKRVIEASSKPGSIQDDKALPSDVMGQRPLVLIVARGKGKASKHFWMPLRGTLVACRYDGQNLLWVADDSAPEWSNCYPNAKPQPPMALVTRLQQTDYFRIARGHGR